MPTDEVKTYHFIQHTHTDPGWIETMASYVKIYLDNILSNVPVTLINNPRLAVSKFSFTNVDFPWNFKKRFPEKWQYLVYSIKKGSLKMLNDGVVMPDQACTYFEDIINVYEYGREFSLKEFGVMTRAGWAIDTFGHSSTTATLLAEMGYDYEAVYRISGKRRLEVMKDRNFLVKWKQRYPEDDLMTYVLQLHYAPLYFGRNEIAKGDYEYSLLSVDFNGLERTSMLYFFIRDLGEFNKFSNIPIFMGDDFAFDHTQYYFYVLRSLYICLDSNKKSAFKGDFKISFPDEVFSAIKAENKTYKDFEGDFLPMSELNPKEGFLVWNGFFYGRANLKYAIKEASLMARGLTNFIAYHRLSKSVQTKLLFDKLLDARFFTGILMHHDAITGTCANNVVRDYYRMMADAERLLNDVAKESLTTFLGVPAHIIRNQTIRVEDSIVSKSFVLVSQDIPGPRNVRFECPNQIAESLAVKVGEKKAIDRWVCGARCELSIVHDFGVFEAVEVLVENKSEKVRELRDEEAAVTEVYQCTGQSIRVGDLDVSLGYYTDTPLTYFEKFIYEHGMYVFRTPFKRPFISRLTSCRYHVNPDGSYVVSASTVQPIFKTLSLILAKEPKTGKWRVEESRIETSDIRKKENVDLVVLYKVHGFKNNRVFYTDSNGLGFEKRVFEPEERIELNYFPISKMAQLSDINAGKKFTVMTDRPQGATNPEDGLLEIAYQRANLGTDVLGANEIDFEFEPTLIRHRLILEDIEGASHRSLQAITDTPLLLLETDAPSNLTRASSPAITRSKEAAEVPLYIRTLLDVREGGTMFRVYNMHDTETFTIPDIKLFVKQRYGLDRDVKLEERSLDFNQPIETILNQPYLWRNVSALKKAHEETVQGDKIILRPLTMKTFKITP